MTHSSAKDANSADFIKLNNTLQFFLDYNHYDYYSLNFIRFYAKKSLKILGFYDGNNDFHTLVENLLSLTDKKGSNAEGVLAVSQLAQILNEHDNTDKVSNLEEKLGEVFKDKFKSISPMQQVTFIKSVLGFSNSLGIKLKNQDDLNKIVTDYDKEHDFFNNLDGKKLFSIVCSIVVAFSEAIAAVYFFGVYSVSTLIGIGFPALVVNYLLFYPSVEKAVYKYFNDAPVDIKAKESSFFDYLSTALKLTLATAAGAMTAFIALNSMLETFGVVIYGLSPSLALANPPLGLISVVSAIAFSSFIANTALLFDGFDFKNISYFLGAINSNNSDEAGKDIDKKNNFILYRIYNNFVDLFKNLYETNISAALANLGKLALDTIMLGAAAALSVSIYVVTLGLFKNQAIKTLHTLCGLSHALSETIAFVTVTLCGQLLNGMFYVDKILKPLNDLGIFLFGSIMGIVKSKEDSCDEVLETLESQNMDISDNDKDIISNLSNSAKADNMPVASTCITLGVIAGFSWINGDSQGRGFGSDELSINNLQWLSAGYLSTKAANLYGYFLGTVSSFIANYEQAANYILEDKSEEERRLFNL